MEYKCPKCNSKCWRDEHPDGYYVGLWSCSNCNWQEARNEINNIDIKKLPF